MVVLRGVLGPIGILADSVRGIVRVPSARLVDLPEDGTFQGCATSAVDLDGGVVHLLSPAALLEAHEARSLADYGALSRARLRHLREESRKDRDEPMIVFDGSPLIGERVSRRLRQDPGSL